jgi:PhnB protein
MAYKPDGHSTVSPYLIIADAEAALAFIKAVFGVEPTMMHRTAKGNVGHCEIRIEDSILMLGEMPGAAGVNLHVYVADVDAAFARALAAGGTEVQAVAEKGDGDRRGGVRDPSGTTWWLATHLG